MLTASNANQYSKPLTVGPSYSTASNLQGGNVSLQHGYNPQSDVNVLGAMTTVGPPAVVGPTADQIAQSNAINNGRNLANVKYQGLQTGGTTSLSDIANQFRSSNVALANQVRQGQEDINTQRANNELNLRRTMSGIAGGVRQGLQSAGVQLANSNASDSGAEEAFARAYAQLGNRGASAARNQAEIASNTLNTAQSTLDTQKAQKLDELRTWRSAETARVSNKLWQDMAELEAQSKASGYGGIVDMGMRDRLVAAATAQLDAIDSSTQSQLGSIQALTPEQVQARAMQLEQAGANLPPAFGVEGPQGGAFTPQTPIQNGPDVGQITPGPRPRDEQNRLF